MTETPQIYAFSVLFIFKYLYTSLGGLKWPNRGKNTYQKTNDMVMRIKTSFAYLMTAESMRLAVNSFDYFIYVMSQSHIWSTSD